MGGLAAFFFAAFFLCFLFCQCFQQPDSIYELLRKQIRQLSFHKLPFFPFWFCWKSSFDLL